MNRLISFSVRLVLVTGGKIRVRLLVESTLEGALNEIITHHL